MPAPQFPGSVAEGACKHHASPAVAQASGGPSAVRTKRGRGRDWWCIGELAVHARRACGGTRAVTRFGGVLRPCHRSVRVRRCALRCCARRRRRRLHGAGGRQPHRVPV